MRNIGAFPNPTLPQHNDVLRQPIWMIPKSFYLAVWLVIGTISNQLTTLPSN